MIDVIPVLNHQFSQLSYILHDSEANECLIVDPGPTIAVYIPKGAKIQAVINTHIHFDHTLGNHYFRGKSPVFAHPGEKTWYYRSINAVFCTLFSHSIPARVRFDLHEGMRFYLGGEQITVMHTPGHSAGSICLYWPDNLLSGDTIFSGGIGRVDVPLSNPIDMKQSLQRLIKLPENTNIWPGHAYEMPYPVTMASNRRIIVWSINSL